MILDMLSNNWKYGKHKLTKSWNSNVKTHDYIIVPVGCNESRNVTLALSYGSSCKSLGMRFQVLSIYSMMTGDSTTALPWWINTGTFLWIRSCWRSNGLLLFKCPSRTSSKGTIISSKFNLRASFWSWEQVQLSLNRVYHFLEELALFSSCIFS